MKCELCGGLVTWRGPLSALTHTECENCGGQNCQVVEVAADEEDEPHRDFIVGHSEMHGGWCVYEQAAYADYEVLRGPFAGREAADAALAEMLA